MNKIGHSICYPHPPKDGGGGGGGGRLWEAVEERTGRFPRWQELKEIENCFATFGSVLQQK